MTAAGVIPAGTKVLLDPGDPSDVLLHLANVGIRANLPGSFWIAPHEWFVLYSDGELLSVPGPLGTARSRIRFGCRSEIWARRRHCVGEPSPFDDHGCRPLAHPFGPVTGWRETLGSPSDMRGGRTLDKGTRVTVPISGDVVTTTHWDSSKPQALKPVLDSLALCRA